MMVASAVLLALLIASGTACAKNGPARWEARFEGIDEPFYSVVWLTDTQTMVQHPRLYPALRSMFRWIIDSKDKCNTICVVHTGDIVEYGGNEDYWARITPLIEEVREVLPFIPVAGNHDIDHTDGDWRYYLSQPFVEYLPSAQAFRQGKGLWFLAERDGLEILILGLGYDMTGPEPIGWAKKVFAEHPHAAGVFMTHSYLSHATSKTSVYTANGKDFHDRLVSSCPGIRFVLCGHVKGTGHIVERYDDDGDGIKERAVHVLRYNYQESETLKRAGFLRVLTVFPSSGRVRVYTYSPYLDLEVYDSRTARREHFIIDGLS